MRGVIAIDGPSASGKSSVARRVAQALGVPYVSSGLLYRGVAYLVQQTGQDPDQAEGILALLTRSPLRLIPLPDGNQIWQGDQQITTFLHTPEIDRLVSRVAIHPRVRGWVDQQLRLLPPPLVVEGRDMGTAVFPQATLKVYLTAQPEVRAVRRVPERGEAYQQVLDDLLNRDRLDAGQSAPAADAWILDTSTMNLEQVVEAILRRVAQQRD
jgi:cytidylate kinase